MWESEWPTDQGSKASPSLICCRRSGWRLQWMEWTHLLLHVLVLLLSGAPAAVRHGPSWSRPGTLGSNWRPVARDSAGCPAAWGFSVCCSAGTRSPLPDAGSGSPPGKGTERWTRSPAAPRTISDGAPAEALGAPAPCRAQSPPNLGVPAACWSVKSQTDWRTKSSAKLHSCRCSVRLETEFLWIVGKAARLLTAPSSLELNFRSKSVHYDSTVWLICFFLKVVINPVPRSSVITSPGSWRWI